MLVPILVLVSFINLLVNTGFAVAYGFGEPSITDLLYFLLPSIVVSITVIWFAIREKKHGKKGSLIPIIVSILAIIPGIILFVSL